MSYFKFEVIHQSKKSKARIGRIHTPHGIINTPNFVAVGTNGTLKALDNEQVSSIGLELMFCNTYHLILQPGTQVIKQAGGLHKFINRKTPLITDSGGFQVFSLAYGSVHDELKSRGTKKGDGCVLKITEDGVLFRSYRDGAKVLLTPETSIRAQKDLGADIIIPLDELPPYHIEENDLKKSLARTHRWEIRSLQEHRKNLNNQAIFGVIHGGIDEQLRKLSCVTLTEHPFDGFAIGGSVGKNKEELKAMLKVTRPHLPDEKPIHLLGIGDQSLPELIPYGVDTFDSSYPTRAARHGYLFTKTGGIKLSQTKHAAIFNPIEKECRCPTCQKYTLAYLHHLYKAKEMTVCALATAHNLHFMIEMMRDLRKAIAQDQI